MQTKITVYITSHDYGRYLTQAVESVIEQTLPSWELWIVDDGSSDETREIAKSYAASDERIQLLVHDEARGLRECANEVLELARGQYIIRLDADDYFDENALLVLSDYLDTHPEVGLVFPNWVYINEDGNFLGIENRKKIGRESKVLDLPAHGACTMVRRRVLKSIGGYDPQHDSQDGHELWIKVLHRHGVANVTTPLFFYRQHGSSMSSDQSRLLNARQKIKRLLAERTGGPIKPRIVAVVPAKNTYAEMPNIALEQIAGKTLIEYAVDEARAANCLECIFVYTDDPRVVDHCDGLPGVLTGLRDAKLSEARSTLAQVIDSAVRELESNHGIYPDIVVSLSVHSPMRRSHHIQEAIDTLIHYDVETVISTFEDLDLHFRHGELGLEPINPSVLKQLRFERETIFVDNGAVHAMWRDFIGPDCFYKGRIGHIVMQRSESLQIKSHDDLETARARLSATPRSNQ